VGPGVGAFVSGARVTGAWVVVAGAVVGLVLGDPALYLMANKKGCWFETATKHCGNVMDCSTHVLTCADVVPLLPFAKSACPPVAKCKLVIAPLFQQSAAPKVILLGIIPHWPGNADAKQFVRALERLATKVLVHVTCAALPMDNTKTNSPMGVSLVVVGDGVDGDDVCAKDLAARSDTKRQHLSPSPSIAILCVVVDSRLQQEIYGFIEATARGLRANSRAQGSNDQMGAVTYIQRSR
jgi:hypothetical protein